MTEPKRLKVVEKQDSTERELAFLTLFRCFDATRQDEILDILSAMARHKRPRTAPHETMPAMDRTTLEERLRQADEHIAIGERHIDRQRRLIAEMAREGQKADEALRVLGTLEAGLRAEIADRERLRSERDGSAQAPEKPSSPSPS